MTRVAVSGGGTGGHIYPAVAIAREIVKLRPEVEIIYIGGEGRRESSIIPDLGFEFEGIPVEAFPRSLSSRWFRVAFKVPMGLFKTMAILKRFKPDIAIGTGGYVCGPVLLGAKLLNVPILIQEQNALPGVTNRILGRWADEIHVPYMAAVKYFPTGRIRLTGNPVRPEIATAERNYEKLGLKQDKLTISFVGGSQGASSINMAAVEAFKRIPDLAESIQIIHQTGKTDFSDIKDIYDNMPFTKLVQPYFDAIQEVYAVTDLIVCRSGAMTLAEVTARGLPAVLVPYPYSAEGHQLVNAMVLEDKGAAVMIEDVQLTGERLAAVLSDLIQDRGKLSKMAAISRSLGKLGAARKIAESALSIAESKRNAWKN